MRTYGLGFRVEGFRSRILSPGSRNECLEFTAEGLWSGVHD
jgi:hypothetical protein